MKEKYVWLVFILAVGIFIYLVAFVPSRNTQAPNGDSISEQEPEPIEGDAEPRSIEEERTISVNNSSIIYNSYIPEDADLIINKIRSVVANDLYNTAEDVKGKDAAALKIYFDANSKKINDSFGITDYNQFSAFAAKLKFLEGTDNEPSSCTISKASIAKLPDGMTFKLTLKLINSNTCIFNMSIKETLPRLKEEPEPSVAPILIFG
jgi:hypothetical protein